MVRPLGAKKSNFPQAPPLSMEFLDQFLQPLSPLTLGVALIAFLLSFWFLETLLSNNVEAAVDYTVPIPEQCKPGWKGEELQDPQIKVRLLLPSTKPTDIDSDTRLKRNTMLLSSQWQAPRPRQPHNA